MKTASRILVGIFLLLLALPGLQSLTRLLPLDELAGAEKLPEERRWSPAAWLDGDFQRHFERRLDVRMGLRAWMVRTDNQIGWSLFGETPAARGGTRVLAGRDGWLFEEGYVKTYNRPARQSSRSIERRAKELGRLQEELRRRDIGFLLVLAPSKVEVYPELTREGTLKPGREKRRTARDILLPFLEREKIEFLDGQSFFLAEKQRSATPLFAPGGTHWNYYGAALTVRETLRRLEQQTGKSFAGPKIAGVTRDGKVEGTDDDLGTLLNLWWRRPPRDRQTHPILASGAPPGAVSPNILLVGDSFALTLTKVLEMASVPGRVDNFYYFNRRFVTPGDLSEPIDRETIDLRRELAGRDAVVIEIGEAWLPDIGFGFVSQALAALESH